MNISTLRATQNPVIVADGLIGFWNMQEGAGSYCNDYSDPAVATQPAFFNGSGPLPTWTTDGQHGPCMYFSGSVNNNSQSLKTNYHVTTNPATTLNAFSVVCWAWLEALHPTNVAHVIYSNRTSNGGGAALGDGIVAYAFSASAAGGQGWNMGYYSASLLNRIRTNVAIIPKTWYHLGWTHAASTTTNGMYINGAATGVQVEVNSARPGWLATSNFTIGREAGDATPGSTYQGKIAGVRLYNRAITPAEITLLYNATKP